MPKRNIKDLWPNECIHCPDEESDKIICQMMHSLWMKRRDRQSYAENTCWYCYKKDTVHYPKNNTVSDIYDAKENWHTIYPHTDFVDEEEKEPDTTPVRPWPFRTGDEVELWVAWWRSLWVFWWYTTDWWFIAKAKQHNNYHVYDADNCRHPLKKHQHTISCTDEVWEKVKSIEWVDLFDNKKTW